MFGQTDNQADESSNKDKTNDLNSQIPAVPAPASTSSDDNFGLSSSDNSSPIISPQPAGPVHTKPSSENDLLDIKQKALQELSPLVKHLEQSPTDKFKTTMMMIQASDNQDLIPEAYEAANKILNEKEKAQALLDIVNEINYFTNKDAA